MQCLIIEEKSLVTWSLVSCHAGQCVDLCIFSLSCPELKGSLTFCISSEGKSLCLVRESSSIIFGFEFLILSAGKSQVSMIVRTE